MAGYYVEKHKTLNKNLDDKTEDELEEDLLKIERVQLYCVHEKAFRDLGSGFDVLQFKELK